MGVQRNESALTGRLVDFRPRTLLHFLGLTSKTGVLRLAHHDRRVALWFERGQVAGAGEDGTADALDAVVDILRIADGRFSFDEGATPPLFAREPRQVTHLLESAIEAVMDWEECAQVVPSTALVVELQEAPDEARLSADAWAVSVAVAGGHTSPDQLAGHLRWPLLRTCRAVKELVDGGRAELSPPPRPRTAAAFAGEADAVLTTADRSLWPGAGSEGTPWRTAWYSEDA